MEPELEVSPIEALKKMLDETIKVIGYDNSEAKKEARKALKSKKKAKKVFDYDEKPIQDKKSGFKCLMDRVSENAVIQELMTDILKQSIFDQ